MFKPGEDRIEYGGALIDEQEVNAIMDVIKSQGGRRWTIGPNSKAFEQELAEVAGVNHAVVVNSGSSALLVALAALKLPKGSKVVIPACNFPTAFNAIIQNDYFPVVVDVELDTLNIDLNEVETAMELYPDIKAVIAVNIAGNPVDLLRLRRIVGNDVKIVLDDCDGFGTRLNDEFVEIYSDIAAVSFHAAHIITTGEGGAVLTNDAELAARATKLREWGRASGTDKIYNYPGFPKDYKERYVYEEIGWNMKPLELQCAMGRVQLKKLHDFYSKRKANYEEMFKRFDRMPKFKTIKTIDGGDPCWFSFPILCWERDRGQVMEAFEKANIETRTIFSGNIMRHPAYKDVDHIKVGNLSNSDYIMETGMFLSVHPSITMEMIDYIEEVAKGITTNPYPV